MSRELVTLHDDVEIDTPLAATRTTELDATRLIAFLKAIELSTLTKRVAEASGVDPNSVAARPGAEIRQAPRRHLRRPAVAAGKPEADAAEADAAVSRPTAASPLPLGGKSLGEGEGEGGAGAQPAANGHARPTARAAAGAQAAAAVPFDRGKYETVTSLARLDAWIAEAGELGRVAVDTETIGAAIPCRPRFAASAWRSPPAAPATCRSPIPMARTISSAAVLFPARFRRAKRSPA